LGTLCLWSGISAVAEACGLTTWTAKLLAPVLKLLFPTARRDEQVMKAISLNMTANLLGLGNAATPLGIKAMKELKRAGGNLFMATKDMALFVVINTASLQILPTTVAALRLDKVPPPRWIFCRRSG
jgi:spore maturation protein A